MPAMAHPPLDATGQRILGVLIEKELAVPDSYPMSTNAVVAGCNQKSNRDPVLTLEDWQVEGALEQLRLEGWVARFEGGRVSKWRHLADDVLGVDGAEKAVFAELLLRGPQAPGALKSRVGRMGFQAAGPDAVRAVLDGLKARPPGALVALLPRQPRERDARWAHLLGDSAPAVPAPALDEPPRPVPSQEIHASPPAVDPVPATGGSRVDELEDRVLDLERRVAELEDVIEKLQG